VRYRGARQRGGAGNTHGPGGRNEQGDDAKAPKFEKVHGFQKKKNQEENKFVKVDVRPYQVCINTHLE
jgi:hypothetical protein